MMFLHAFLSNLVTLLVLCVGWTPHVCKAFQIKSRTLPSVGRSLSALKSEPLVSVATSTTTSPSPPSPSSPPPRIHTTGKIIIVTESDAKSATIRNMIQQFPAPFQLQHQIVVYTCPKYIATLAPMKKSVRETVKDSAEIDFSIAVDSLLNPTFRNAQSKVIIDKIDDIHDTLKENNVTQIMLAFNMDNRGELLAHNLLSVLNVPKNVTISRLKLTELTPTCFLKSLNTSLLHSRNHLPDCNNQLFDMDIVEGQLTEQVVDQTISFAVSQALYSCIGDYYSLGRVKCAALNLVVEREKILNLIKLTPSYTLKSKFKMKLNMQKSRFPSWIYVFAELCSVNNRTVACSHSEDFEDNKVVLNAEQVGEIAELCDLFSTKFKLSSCDSKVTMESPPEPLNITALLNLSARYLHLTPQKTLIHAQSLYEKGFITYPNTACSQFTASEYDVIFKAAVKSFGVNNVNPASREKIVSSVDAADSDSDAYASVGAIRPVFTADGPISPPDDSVLDKEERKLFTLILRNSLASVMRPARHQTTESIVKGSLPRRRMRGIALNNPPITCCAFNSIKKTTLDPGFRMAYLPSMARNTEQLTRPMPESGDSELSALIGVPAFLAPLAPVKESETSLRGKSMSQIYRKMPALSRFTPSNLLSELSRRGIISKNTMPLSTLTSLASLEKHKFLQMHPSHKWSFWDRTFVKEGEIQPSKKGMFIIHYLKTYFNFLLHPLFSSTLQEKFDAIGNGSLKKDQFIDMFAFGSNETLNSTANVSSPSITPPAPPHSPPPFSLFKRGFFRSLTDRVRSKQLLRSESHPDINSSDEIALKSQYIGKDPSTKQPMHIHHGDNGFFLHIGRTSTSDAGEDILHGKQYPLPSWLSPNTSMITTIKDALAFTTLPKVFYFHPSMHQPPITLLMSQGLLCVQLGKVDQDMPSADSCQVVPLEAGLFPSDVTMEMASNKINRV